MTDKERGPDEKVLGWFKRLGLEEAAQTVTEHNEQDSKLLRQMVEKVKAAGEGLFCTPGDELQSNANSGFLFKKFSFFEFNAGNTFFHTERARESERRLVSSVRLCDTRVSLDTITVCTDVLVDRDSFLSLLSVVSQGEFFTVPCQVGWDVTAKEWRWDIPSWFEKKGYYTIAEFLAQWLEKVIWRRYFESNRIDPRKTADRSRAYKASSNNQLSTQAVLDPRKGRLKLFWNGLTDEEREKLSDVKVGQVMAKVVASEEKVDYMKMLKTLQKLTQDKTSKSHCFEDNLRKDPVQFIEYLYLSSLEVAGKVREKVLRHIGDTLQNACAEKLAMDLIHSEEQAKNKPPHHSDSSVRFGKKKKNNISKRKKPLTSPSLPSPIKEKGRLVDLLVLNGDDDMGDAATGSESNKINKNENVSPHSSGQSENSNSTTNSNKNSNQISQVSITRRKEKKKKNKKKKQGGRDNGTVSANDAGQRSIASSSPSSANRTRRHRHSLPEDFAQTHQDVLAQIRAGKEPTDYEDEEEVETVSDGELNDRDADATLTRGREIVAISEEEMDEVSNEAVTSSVNIKIESEAAKTPRRDTKSPHDPPPPAPAPTNHQPTTTNFKRSSSSNAISDIAKREGTGASSGGGSSGSSGGFTSVVTGRRQRNASVGSCPAGSPHLPTSTTSKSSTPKPHQQSSPRGQQQQQQTQQQGPHHYTTPHSTSTHSPSSYSSSTHSPSAHSSSHPSSPHHPRSLSVSAPSIQVPVTNNTQQQQTQRNVKLPTKQSLAIQALSLHESNQQTAPHPRIRDIHAQTLAQSPTQPKNTAPPKASHSTPLRPSSSSTVQKSSAKFPASYASAVAPTLASSSATSSSSPTTSTMNSHASSLSSTSAPTPLTVPSPAATSTPPILSSSTSAPSLLTSVTLQPASTKTSTQSLSIPLSSLSNSNTHPSHSAPLQTSSLSSSTPSPHVASFVHHVSSSAPTASTISFYKSLSSSSLSDMVVPLWAGHFFPYHHYFSDRSLQLHHEMVDFVNYINGMAHTHQLICQLTITRVAAVVTRLWPASRVEVFGSFASGLWMPSSDIDLVIVGVNYGARGQIGPQTTQFLLQILERELEKEPWVQSIQSIANTRVPVMKLVSKDGNVPIDITFSETSTHHTGIASRNLVIQYVASLPALAPLALVIKTFLRERGLNNTYTGGLSSYCLVLMIISFLHHHYLSHPPLPLGAPAIETNNWGILLLGFLNFYGKDFDYQHTGISITPGRSTFPLTLSPAPHSFPSYHQPFHHLPPHIHTSIDIQEDALHIPAYTAHALAQPSYAHTFLSHPPLDNPTEFSVFPDTLQFPLESPLPPLPTQEPTQFTTAPHIFIEDPIRKGNNISSHAFLMTRVQAALEFAKNALKNSPNSAPSLLSRILNTRPCDIASSSPLILPHLTFPLSSVRSLPS